MNAAHAHLVLTHLPIVAVPVALIFLLHALRKGDVAGRRFAYLVLAAAALLAVPVFLTGEEAEEVVEHLPGVLESVIEEHEELGKIAMILSVGTGVLSLAGYFIDRIASARSALLRRVVVLSALATVAALGFAGNLGGQVRHTEIRSGATAVDDDSPEGSAQSHHESSEDDDD